IRKYILDEQVARVKIWSPQGKVIYSDEPDLIGKTFEVEDDLIEAMDGEVVMDVSELEAAENVDERGKFSRLFEIYVPLVPSDSSKPEAIYEIYHDVAAVEDYTARTRSSLWSALGIAFVVLYTSLFTLVRNASHSLTKQSAESARLYREARSQLAERLRAEEARRASEERFETIFASAAVGIALSDMNGRIVECNPALQQLLGYSADELRALTLPELAHPEDVATNLDMFRELRARSRTYYQVVERCVRKDGSHVWANLNVSVLCDEHGTPQYTICMVENTTEERRANERVQQQLQRLAALRSIDMAISSSMDLRVTLDVVLDKVISQLGVDAAHVMLLHPHTQTLQYAASRGFHHSGIFKARQPLGDGYAGKAALERRTLNVPDLQQVRNLRRGELIEGEGFITYYVVPLVAKGQVKGALEVFHRSRLEPDAEWLDYLEALAGQAAIAIENATLFDDLQRSNTELVLAYEATLEGWSHALDLRDRETEGHTQRVTDMTVRLAQKLGVPAVDIVQIQRGALLHDIGKMGIPDSILLKPGPLTDEEWEIMRKHPVYAFELLSPISFLRPALDIPYAHHEKWDGTGYPRGLKGEQIPLAARIFAVVDVYDALRSNRPYRRAWPEAKVLAHIWDLSGTHFDPRVVEAFLELAKQ
ncbi:MAG TPA: HD domain-containing phosphohydrolase, partial [Chloroflexia bacterium]